MATRYCIIYGGYIRQTILWDGDQELTLQEGESLMLESEALAQGYQPEPQEEEPAPPVPNVFSGSTTIDMAPIPANTEEYVDIYVAGARATHVPLVGLPDGLGASLSRHEATIPLNDTVRLTFRTGGAPLAPGNRTFNARVIP